MNHVRNACSVLVALALIASSALADTIVLRGGKKPLTGVKVQTESITEVTYTEGSSTKRVTLPADQVAEIIYDAQPAAYRRGAELFYLGDLTNAVERLKESFEAEKDKTPWVREYAGFLLGRAYLGTSQYAEAIRVFEKVMSERPDTRFLGEISLALALAHSAAGDAARAESVLTTLQSAVKTKNVPGDWAVRADLMRGEVMIAAKKFDQAAALMKDLAVKSQQNLALYAQARRLEGEAFLQAGDVRQAAAVFDELKSKGVGSEEAMAAARSGSAAAAMQPGASDEDLYRALEQLSRAWVENFRAVSQLPRTCYLLGLIHLQLDGKLDNARSIAKGYLEETLRRFPESREALLAREQLKKL